MSKQSKITVKHFLNTNLKPYVINGISYYSVYVLLTAQRQNTRVKSIALNEFYSEKDFEDIIKSKDNDAVSLINEEISTLTKITELVINELKEFDTHFITAYFNFSENINIYDIDIEVFKFEKTARFYNKEDNKAGIDLSSYLFKGSDLHPNIKLYNFFANQNQNELRQFLIDNKCKTNVNDTLEDINRMYFYRSFDKFKWFLGGSKRNKLLLEKYKELLQHFNDIINLSITNKYTI
ncbi:hypothetical protein BWK63_04970 [Flavobacterium covae]|uniref:hypothetical protein n=1 Tax=Flavobacterium covae TaxID=2906076 RepID=UPI000B4CFD81|nr:hypothetical protein [Flavobacterium covae]OWP81638.1 hypothetical protein BWK63_04970 [Flavobacterium covae]